MLLTEHLPRNGSSTKELTPISALGLQDQWILYPSSLHKFVPFSFSLNSPLAWTS
jgi:hypothetical protein